MLEYETANPGADFNEKEAEVFHFDEDNAADSSDVARPNVTVGNPEYTADNGGVRPSTSQASGQMLGSDGRIGSSGSNTRSMDQAYREAPRGDWRGGDQRYGDAPRVEQGIPHTEQGDLHPGFAPYRRQ